MRILLTGATGFVGEAFVRSISSGDEVVYLGRKELSLRNKRVTFVYADLADKYSVVEAAKSVKGSFDVLVHLAAFVPRSRAEDTLQSAYGVNVAGTIHLLEAFHGRIHKIVMGSTLEVYDQTKIRGRIDEDVPVNAASYYGSTKFASELIARTYGAKNDIPTLVLRFSIIYGPNDPISRALPNFIKAALNDQEIAITGGQILRDYIHIDDVVRSLRAAVESENSGVANIGTGTGVTIRDAAQCIVAMSQSRSRVVLHPGDGGVDIVVDPKTARDLIGFSAQVFFPDNIEEMIESYK